MKKGLLFAIVALAAIAIVAGFGFQLASPEVPEMSAEMADNILFVCPASSSTWDPISLTAHIFIRYIIGGFFFAAVLLLFGWGWQLYQNLLSDKFKRDSFKNIWGFTKIWFWALIVIMIALYTPNYFRGVKITGATGDWVLCNDSDYCNPNLPNCHTRMVRADAVHAY